jgi:hypothetical protein
MAALSEGEKGRKEKAKSLPLSLYRTAQRRQRNLTGRWKKTQRKNLLSGERREFRTNDLYFIKCDPSLLSYLLGTRVGKITRYPWHLHLSLINEREVIPTFI